MKRSEMVTWLEEQFKGCDINADTFLTNLTAVMRMEPPKIEVQLTRPKNYPYGGGCSMRCNCEDCNPKFLINAWTPE